MCRCPGCDEMSCGLPDCDECDADQVSRLLCCTVPGYECIQPQQPGEKIGPDPGDYKEV